MMRMYSHRVPTFRVAHIASEVHPFSKTGGLASVLGSLPEAQREFGVSALVITPFYKKCIDPALTVSYLEKESIEIEPGVFEEVSYRQGFFEGGRVPVFFIENAKFFGKSHRLYGERNDNARFLFFNIAALALLKRMQYAPDIIHCHDWHAGIIPFLLKTRHRRDSFWKGTATLFTIHNLSFQLGHDWFSIPQEEVDDGRSKLPSFSEVKQIEQLNFAKRAILFADTINTVSETYRDEILTNTSGEQLHRFLWKRRNVVFGIVNGINYEEFNPLTDPGLVKHYSDRSFQLKKYNKKAVQVRYGLTVGVNIPLICVTSRISEQKGFNLILRIIRTVLRMGVQCVVMGNGNEESIKLLREVQEEFPHQFVYTPFDQKKETLLYAGSDIFLLPSRFEPCGINQMIALRYGCIPVVRHIGGLADTIEDYDPRTKTGNGFVFHSYRSTDLLVALVRALESSRHARSWRALSIRGLRESHSWKIPARKYVDLYRLMLRTKKEKRNRVAKTQS